jgi:hypothetical protein
MPPPEFNEAKSFPLPPQDAHGRAIVVGSTVKIQSVESCATELPHEDQKRLRSMVGSRRSVVQFDRYGFVWLSFSETECGADFCLSPGEVSLA